MSAWVDDWCDLCEDMALGLFAGTMGAITLGDVAKMTLHEMQRWVVKINKRQR